MVHYDRAHRGGRLPGGAEDAAGRERALLRDVATILWPGSYGVPDADWKDGWRGCLGNEPTIEMFIAHLVGIFAEVKRVLRKDGTLWVVIGDSYAGSNAQQGGDGSASRLGPNATNTQWTRSQQAMRTVGQGRIKTGQGLKPKDLCMIPARLALALQGDGWWLRSDCIWSKPNPMPESVTDRPTRAHEYVFMFAKSARYYWDAEAVREPLSPATMPRVMRGVSDNHKHVNGAPGQTPHSMSQPRAHGEGYTAMDPAGRNIRSVWEVATEPLSMPHYAAFPTALVEPMIKAATSQYGCCAKCGAPWVRVVEKQTRPPCDILSPKTAGKVAAGFHGAKPGLNEPGWRKLPPSQHTIIGWRAGCGCAADVVPATVLDPFSGAGTTLLVANRLGRDGIGIELNPEYAAMSEKRIADDAGPMFETVTVETPRQMEML